MTVNYSTKTVRRRRTSRFLIIFYDLRTRRLVDLNTVIGVVVIATAIRRRRQRPTTPFPPTTDCVHCPLQTLVPLSNLPHARYLLAGYRFTRQAKQQERQARQEKNLKCTRKAAGHLFCNTRCT